MNKIYPEYINKLEYAIEKVLQFINKNTYKRYNGNKLIGQDDNKRYCFFKDKELCINVWESLYSPPDGIDGPTNLDNKLNQLNKVLGPTSVLE